MPYVNTVVASPEIHLSDESGLREEGWINTRRPFLKLVGIPPENCEEVAQELLRVLLSHRRELLVPFADERLESRRSQSFLEDWVVNIDSTVRRMRVAAAQKPIGNLAHLAFNAIGRKG